MSTFLVGLLVAAPRIIAFAGQDPVLALRDDGSIVGWGLYATGALGPNTAGRPERQQRTAPVVIALPGKAVEIASCGSVSLALLEDGTLVGWGDGACLNGKKSETPIAIEGIDGKVKSITAHNGAALAVMTDGTVTAWGGRGSGRIGDGLYNPRWGETSPVADKPVKVKNVDHVVMASMGPRHVLALRDDGRVYSWGSNYFGALGREPWQEPGIDAADIVPGLTDVTMVYACDVSSFAAKKDGSLWTWGSNQQGQFGNGKQSDSIGVNSGWQLTAEQVPNVKGARAVTCGSAGRHVLALMADGTLRGWGNTDWGQVGAGKTGDYQLTVVTPKIDHVAAVHAANNYSFAVKTDGTFWAWGIGDRHDWPLLKNTKFPFPIPDMFSVPPTTPPPIRAN